ncbi:hypothetical protein FACS189454_03240 [Planctomycetales bacterium]|nr:hypothetical protein FACS189454_03240 [Planctomycetales bacterium]
MGGVSVLWIGTTIEFWDASEMYVLLCIYLGCISVLSLWGILAFRWHRSTVTIHKTTEYAE